MPTRLHRRPHRRRSRHRSGHPCEHDGREPAMIVGVSLLGGLIAALALVAGPFAGGDEPTITAAILLGFAFGWALLAVLSARFTDHAQRWAAVPAAAMALTAIALLVLAPGAGALDASGWVWPPGAARARRLDDRPRPPPAARPRLILAAVPRLRRPGAGRRRRRLRDPARRDRARPHPPRGQQAHRRRRPSTEHPLHRYRRPDRGPRTGARRIRHGDGAVDRPGRRPHDHDLRLRPCRPRTQRPCPRHADRLGARSPRSARTRARPQAVRPCRPLARRTVRAQLHGPLSRAGRRPRAARRVPGRGLAHRRSACETEQIGSDFSVFLTQRTAGDYDISRNRWGADYPHANNQLSGLFACGGGNNDRSTATPPSTR